MYKKKPFLRNWENKKEKKIYLYMNNIYFTPQKKKIKTEQWVKK